METSFIKIILKLNSIQTINCNLLDTDLWASLVTWSCSQLRLIYIGRYKILPGEKKATFQSHNNEYFLSLNTSFIWIRMSTRMSERICRQAYKILATLLKFNINWRGKKPLQTKKKLFHEYKITFLQFYIYFCKDISGSTSMNIMYIT